MFRFLEEKEGLSFPEAVERLGERYGVEVERESEDPGAEEARRRRERFRELLERTSTFYVSFLWEAPKAQKAREYLARRGLGEEALRAFGVGFAPSAWDQVLTRGQRAGYSVQEMHAAGLVQRGRQGGFYDRFRARITFPVRDPRGRVLGFGARAMGKDAKGPKYLNSPEGVFNEELGAVRDRSGAGGDRAAEPGGRGRGVHGRARAASGGGRGVGRGDGHGDHAGPAQAALGPRRGGGAGDGRGPGGEDAMIRAQKVAGARRMRLRVAAMPRARIRRTC